MVERDPAESSRPATLEDLVKLCRSLNEHGARYVIIGGTAMLNLGFVRATEDIDLLVARGKSEERKLIDGVATLPDGAAREIVPGEIESSGVVRVADEIVVDLMSKASGVSFAEAEPLIEFREIEGVRIPFASAELMLRLKQGLREKDVLDRRFLEALLAKRGR
jgi:hypothetical protein